MCKDLTLRDNGREQGDMKKIFIDKFFLNTFLKESEHGVI